MRANGIYINKLIHLNSYSLINGLNGWIPYFNNNYYDNKSELETIFSEGILYGRGGPGTSTRKLSKCRTRKRMSRVGFLARIRTYNGRKIILRQRRKGRRYLGAKL